MSTSISFKKISYTILSIFTILCLCIMPTYGASRKLINKSISGSFWTSNMLKYSFTATAGVTYNGSTITQQSDLSFGNIRCWSDTTAAMGVISPRQSRKYLSNGTAVYVVTVRRNAQGYYQDEIDYTLTYRASDPGTPYSLGEEQEKNIMILVDVDVGEPYNIQYFK
nr:unnamed protein product [uncultured bacterium]